MISFNAVNATTPRNRKSMTPVGALQVRQTDLHALPTSGSLWATFRSIPHAALTSLPGMLGPSSGQQNTPVAPSHPKSPRNWQLAIAMKTPSCLPRPLGVKAEALCHQACCARGRGTLTRTLVNARVIWLSRHTSRRRKTSSYRLSWAWQSLPPPSSCSFTSEEGNSVQQVSEGPSTSPIWTAPQSGEAPGWLTSKHATAQLRHRGSSLRCTGRPLTAVVITRSRKSVARWSPDDPASPTGYGTPKTPKTAAKARAHHLDRQRALGDMSKV